MVEIRIEFDDDEQYERLKELKKHRGLTWKGLLLEGEKKSGRIPRSNRRAWIVKWSVGFTPALKGGTLFLSQVVSLDVKPTTPLSG
ncbi:hypothetical protein [Halorubrum sp. GN12_10-3_MGM]|uniref:hypothetical protein n=1 Tax=Halorubrum sp. GN12_10-3_MGM TaxID=2518113 RepID=UPI0018EEA233|nr:hypothetical protein [Halorubrum sp. GN12_10-3_MGM]